MRRVAVCVRPHVATTPWLRLCNAARRPSTCAAAMTRVPAAVTVVATLRSAPRAWPLHTTAALTSPRRGFAETTLRLDDTPPAPPPANAHNTAPPTNAAAAAATQADTTATAGTMAALTPEAAQAVQRDSAEAHLRALEQSSASTTAAPPSLTSSSSSSSLSQAARRSSSSAVCTHDDAKDKRSSSSKPRSEVDAVSSIPIGRVVRKVWGYLWPANAYKIRCLVAGSVLCVLVAKCLKVVVPFWFKTIVDALAPSAAVVAAADSSGSVGSAAAMAAAAGSGGALGVGVFGCVVGYGLCRTVASLSEELKTMLFAPVGGHASTQLAMEMFDKLHRLDLHWHLSRETGTLSKDLDRGSRAFWTLAYTLLFLVVPTAFEMTLVCVALQSQAGVQFIAIAGAAVVAYVAWTLAVTNWRARFRARYNALDSRLGGLIVDSLLNYETVKYFGSEQYESDRIRAETTAMNRQLIRLDQSMAVLNVGQQLIFVAAGVLSLYLATCAVLTAGMSVGDLVLIDALLLQLYLPLSYLGMIYREVQTSTQNMQAMIALLDQQSCVCEATDARPYVYVDGTIELRDVCFSYHKPAIAAHRDNKSDDNSNNNNDNDSNNDTTSSATSRPVLQHLSLTIPGGSTVAFVGPSGSGKSTIFRLLYRFYDPSAGAIYLDGQPLAELQLRSVRRCIGVIPQDTVLFNESVRYNIRYGRMDASDAEVEEAARLASLHETVTRMREGYDTPVGERGLKLSGGEKQRVAIARVLLDDPPILLADEATSALDSTTELNVMRTLKAATRRHGPRRTIILIAHRLTTVREADVIFVLDGKGGLAEQGTHFELLCRGGLYADMWYQQLRERRREEAAGARHGHGADSNSNSDGGGDSGSDGVATCDTHTATT